MHNKVSQYVDGTLPKPIGDQVSKSDITTWEHADRKALGDIRMGVRDKILYQIKKYKTSKDAWDALKNLYGKVFEEDL